MHRYKLSVGYFSIFISARNDSHFYLFITTVLSIHITASKFSLVPYGMLQSNHHKIRIVVAFKKKRIRTAL